MTQLEKWKVKFPIYKSTSHARIHLSPKDNPMLADHEKATIRLVCKETINYTDADEWEENAREKLADHFGLIEQDHLDEVNEYMEACINRIYSLIHNFEV